MQPYLEETPDGWAEAVAATWESEQSGDSVRMWGACPTCDHETESVYEQLRTVMGLGGRHTVPVICACAEVHPQTPADKAGCGRAGRIVIELED
jgi:hypothetical protein